jgi:hypothetical protein
VASTLVSDPRKGPNRERSFEKWVANLFSGLTSSTRLSKVCRIGVAVDAVEEAWDDQPRSNHWDFERTILATTLTRPSI